MHQLQESLEASAPETPKSLKRASWGAGIHLGSGKVLGIVLSGLFPDFQVRPQRPENAATLKARKRCDPFPAPQTIRFIGDFLAMILRTCSKTCDLRILIFEDAAIFLRLRVLGTQSFSGFLETLSRRSGDRRPRETFSAFLGGGGSRLLQTVQGFPNENAFLLCIAYASQRYVLFMAGIHWNMHT